MAYVMVVGGQRYRFQDTGCEFSPRCQECPLRRCRLEMGKAERRRLWSRLRRRGYRRTRKLLR